MISENAGRKSQLWRGKFEWKTVADRMNELTDYYRGKTVISPMNNW